MILGSHNSLSYAKPTKWWMKLFNFAAKCQSLTVEEQWDYGVRLFDIRINFNDDYAHHGLIKYDISIKNTMEWLINKSVETNEDVYIYINYEGSLTGEGIKKFETYINSIDIPQNTIHLCGGYCKNPWHKVLYMTNPTIRELHWEFMNFNDPDYSLWTKIKRLFTNIIHFSPKYWAKKDNTTYKSVPGINENYVLMLDFVQL